MQRIWIRGKHRRVKPKYRNTFEPRQKYILVCEIVAEASARRIDKSCAGPTATGRTPFLAQSNPAPFGATRSFIANTPLETALPVVGDVNKTSIFRLMGQLSPYFPNPE